jgi:hypothetical protein
MARRDGNRKDALPVFLVIGIWQRHRERLWRVVRVIRGADVIKAEES